MLLHPFPHAFGLDIDDLSIKLVQLHNVSWNKTHPVFQLATARSLALPPGLIVDGELQQPEEVRKQILTLLGKSKNKQFKPVHSRWVVASIPEVEGFIKLIHTSMPPASMTEESIHDMAQQHIPFGKDEYYLDFQIIPTLPPTKSHETSILLGATLKTVADSYTYLLESLGLGVVALEIEALAIARAMITAKKEYANESRALLDVGATRTGFIVYDHDVIQFSTTLPFSGELVTTAMEQKLNMSRDDAEEQKKKQGVTYRDDPAWPILTQFVDQLALDIEKAIEFYYSHFPDTNPITRITMCGGGSAMEGLDKVLTEKLGIETAPGDPWKNLQTRKRIPIPSHQSLGYAAAIGLALRAAAHPFLPTSFSSGESRV